MKKLTMVAYFFFTLAALALEADYQNEFARLLGVPKENVDCRLEDGTRIDILTATHAIEIDFAHKWGEAIGQALKYAADTGLQPGILLIVTKDFDKKYVDHIKRTFIHWNLPLKLWTVNQDMTEYTSWEHKPLPAGEALTGQCREETPR